MKPHEKMEIELAAENSERAVPAMIGSYPSIAKMSKAYYNELVKEGFSETQALHIVSSQGVFALLNR
jgi:hypothetical protein